MSLNQSFLLQREDLANISSALRRDIRGITVVENYFMECVDLSEVKLLHKASMCEIVLNNTDNTNG